jgi:carbamoyl-phosphate synthase large subunit
MALPVRGTVCITVNDFDKSAIGKLARDLYGMGFSLMATEGTALFLEKYGLPVNHVLKVSEGSPNIVDAMRQGQIQLLINTPLGGQAHDDGRALRSAAHLYRVPVTTTLSAAQATVQGIRALRSKPLKVRSLQVHHKRT